MVATKENLQVDAFELVREVDIDAPLEVTFESILAEIGPEGQMPDGKPFPRVVEAWPGGRWYRDLGNNTGHFWGHVQVIKPPTLLELCGPMFMSFAATNHLQYRLAAKGNGTHLQLTHRAIGLITPELKKGMNEGWNYLLERVRELAEQRKRV